MNTHSRVKGISLALGKLMRSLLFEGDTWTVYAELR